MRGPKTYRKWILTNTTPSGDKVSVVQQTVDSVPISFTVLFRSEPYQKFTRKDPAVALYKRIEAGTLLPEVTTTEDDSEALATQLEKVPYVQVLSLKLQTLVVLQKRELKRAGKHEKHIAHLMFIHRNAPPDAIPSEEKAFLEYLEALIEKLFFNAKSKQIIKMRANFLIATFRYIESLPVALKPWIKLVPGAVARIKKTRKQLFSMAQAAKSHPPYTLTELNQILINCEKFEDVCLILCFLCTGLRARDADNLEYAHVENGRLNLGAVQSKVPTDELPEAALVLRSILRLRKHNDVLAWSVPESVDRQRFRPTFSIMMQLSAVPPVVIKTYLGHRTIAMQMNHYGKTKPNDYTGSATSYFNLKPVTIDGHITSENLWFNWLLFQFLSHAKRLGVLTESKDAVVNEIVNMPLIVQVSADF